MPVFPPEVAFAGNHDRVSLSPCAVYLEQRKRAQNLLFVGSRRRHLVLVATDDDGEFRMDSWLLHHVRSTRHLVLAGNRQVSFGTPLGARRGLLRTLKISSL